ncbi:hypothetical protein yberc0001_25580 [Yersinia bercovieri ATCC 43970]|uniref:Uncharacterized protein n=1 Tax=Yersinia bercovieri ATCC 43970 TaxID=349968 RepID=A0ABP2E1G8_YERBE|nr:hypothetical protein yberc0001_25580 [Yersinia bercovieri ATCC 43970]
MYLLINSWVAKPPSYLPELHIFPPLYPPQLKSALNCVASIQK